MSDDISIPPPGYYNQRRHAGGMDPGTIRLAVIAGGIVAIASFGYLGLSLFHRGGGEVPVIQADDRPIRVKPENPGGMQIAGASNDILSGGSDINGSKLAPAAEAPDPQALRTLTPPAPVKPAPATTTATVVPPAAAPVVPSSPPAKPVAHAAAAAPAVQAHPVAPGKTSIQLAALSSEAAARAEWQILQKRMPDVLAGRQPSISKTERDGKTYWRLRTMGFADVAQAKSTCDKVRAKGGACSVAEF